MKKTIVLLVIAIVVCLSATGMADGRASFINITESDKIMSYVLSCNNLNNSLMVGDGYLLCGGNGESNWVLNINSETLKYDYIEIVSPNKETLYLDSIMRDAEKYYLCYIDVEKAEIQIATWSDSNAEPINEYTLSNIFWAKSVAIEEGFLISGYERIQTDRDGDVFDSIDILISPQGEVIWCERLQIHLEMPWATHSISVVPDGYIFSTEHIIWKRNGDGTLEWLKELPNEYSFDIAGCFSIDDNYIVYGRYFPNMTEEPTTLPVIFLVDKYGDIISNKNIEKKAFSIDGKTDVEIRCITNLLNNEHIVIEVKYWNYEGESDRQNEIILIDSEGNTQFFRLRNENVINVQTTSQMIEVLTYQGGMISLYRYYID